MKCCICNLEKPVCSDTDLDDPDEFVCFDCQIALMDEFADN